MTGSYLAASPVWPSGPEASRLDAEWRALAGAKGVSRATTRAMHERYLEGLSLSEVAREFGVTRQSVYGRFVARGLPMRARRFAPVVAWRGTEYSASAKDGRYRAQAPGRELLHRAVWERAHGPVPPHHEVWLRPGASRATTDASDLVLVDRRRSRRVAVAAKRCAACGGEVARHAYEGPAAYARRLCCSYRCSRGLLRARRADASVGSVAYGGAR